MDIPKKISLNGSSACIPKSKLIKISPVKILPSLILSLTLFGLWSCSDSGEPYINGCMDSTACNSNLDATSDDGSCTYPETNFDCENNCIVTVDACGDCGGNVDNASDCCSDGQVADCAGTCGGGAVEDCNGDCNGTALVDTCGVCSGNGSTCNISYAETIEPLLSSCTGCHGGSGGLSLSTYTNLMTGGNSGAVVTPGDGSGSRLVKKLRGTASEDRMPKGGVFWNDTDINLIETWINEGALDN